MPDKKIRHGMKCFLASDSTNGYVRNLSIYTGANTSN